MHISAQPYLWLQEQPPLPHHAPQKDPKPLQSRLSSWCTALSLLEDSIPLL